MLFRSADRVAALKDDAVRAELIEEGNARGLQYDPDLVHPLGNGAVPDYHMDGGLSVGDLARRDGISPVEVVINRLIESEGREFFNMWYFSRNTGAMDGFFNIDGILPGLADTGAHSGQICDADAGTHFLAHWVRNKRIMPFEKAIRKMTKESTDVLGIRDRGTVETGRFADLNVFSADRLEIAYPEYVNDFPHGKGRLRVNATGYAATLVNGQVITEQGVNTGARPGRVLREFSRN